MHVEPRGGLRGSASASASRRRRCRCARVREIHNVNVIDVDGRTRDLAAPQAARRAVARRGPRRRRAVERGDPRRRCPRSRPCGRTSSRSPRSRKGIASGRGRRRERGRVGAAHRPRADRAGPRASSAFLETDGGLVAFLTLGLDPHTELAEAHATASASRSGSARSGPRSPTSRPHRALRTCAAPVKLCMFTSEGPRARARLAGPHRGRPRHPARRADAAVVLHGRRAGARARRVPARRTSCSARRCCSRRRSATSTPSSSTCARRAPHAASRCRQEWYEIPVFYFSNPAAIYGPEDEIPYPAGSEELDYELEVAAIIGADEQIAGFTVMNDWSARDLQRAEMKVGLGPSKGKDFATSSARSSSRRTSSTARGARWSRASTARSARAARSPTCTTRGRRS